MLEWGVDEGVVAIVGSNYTATVPPATRRMLALKPARLIVHVFNRNQKNSKNNKGKKTGKKTRRL